jgi:hypothetical protein
MKGWSWEELGGATGEEGRERNPSGRRWWWFMYPSITGMDGGDLMVMVCMEGPDWASGPGEIVQFSWASRGKALV